MREFWVGYYLVGNSEKLEYLPKKERGSLWEFLDCWQHGYGRALDDLRCAVIDWDMRWATGHRLIGLGWVWFGSVCAFCGEKGGEFDVRTGSSLVFDSLGFRLRLRGVWVFCSLA